jgi:hypothetical protein
VTTSSAQEDYSITLSDEQIAALNSISAQDTITISSGSSSCYTNPCYTYSIGSGASTISFSNITSTTSASNYCIPNINISNISIWGNSEFVDCFPAWSRIEKMCEEYPGLKIAFEKFKNTYNLVKDDFDTPPERRIKP